MASQNEIADRPEEGAPTPHTTQPEQDHSGSIQELETIKNWIVEIHSLKEDNEKLKKAQEK